MDDDAAFVLTGAIFLVFGTVIGFFVALLMVVPPPYHDFQLICKYNGGYRVESTAGKDVCIRHGEVIKIKVPQVRG